MSGKEPNYYPLMINIADKPCVIVGGGAVAERKAQALLEAGAAVTVVSPEATSRLRQWQQEGKLRLIAEPYRPLMSCIRSAYLIFAATDRPDVNKAVRLEAEQQGKLVNVADDAVRSGFIVPATVRRGKLLIAVSTAGASPAVAKKVKRELEQAFGEEYEQYLDLLQELRVLIQSVVPDTQRRQELFKRMLEWELLSWIRSGRFDERAKAELLERIGLEPTAQGMDAIGRTIREYIE
ncbi:Precorrin-2 dehydrogenase [Paenibacillus konkukensis]|uniref:precorrin-2 dehydrogenase n=2 Tax=Paenibacillus konkukensis TaxID=2020716 RepID=A0ABY4RYX9_9BACL|nr:Precorrin-2 dehydrogenase [Paenibacillus konkukensis]